MKLEFDRTANDLISFYKFDRWHSDERRMFRIKTRFYWGALTSIPFWLLISKLDHITSVTGLIFYALSSFSLGFFGVKHFYLSWLEGLATKIANDKANEELVSPLTLNFSDKAFVWTTKFSSGENHIDSIKKIKEDNGYYYLYNTSISAFVIPKKIFRTAEESGQFRQFLTGNSI